MPVARPLKKPIHHIAPHVHAPTHYVATTKKTNRLNLPSNRGVNNLNYLENWKARAGDQLRGNAPNNALENDDRGTMKGLVKRREETRQAYLTRLKLIRASRRNRQ